MLIFDNCIPSDGGGQAGESSDNSYIGLNCELLGPAMPCIEIDGRTLYTAIKVHLSSQ